jgi:hypothetical protein
MDDTLTQSPIKGFKGYKRWEQMNLYPNLKLEK